MAAPSPRAATPARWPAVLVWGVWLVLSLALFAFVARFGSDFPIDDDDEYVAVLAGEAPASAAWFLAPHVDHLVPIPKAIYLASAATFRDFRAPAFANAALLVAATAALLFAARRLRGRTDWTDVVLPLATLHWGQAASLLCGAAGNLFCSPVLEAATLAVMLRSDTAPRGWDAAALVACLLALPLCGASGLVLVPALAVWTVIASRRATGGTRVALGAAAVGVLALALWMIGTHRPRFETTIEPALVVRTSLQFLGMSTGPAGGFGWPGTKVAESAPPLVSITAAAVLVATGILLVHALFRGAGRLRAGALLAHLAAIAMLAASVGVGRGAEGDLAGIQNRYVTIALPLLWVAWFTLAQRDPAPGVRRVVLPAVVAGALCLFAFDQYAGIIHGRARSERIEAAMAALRSGEPTETVADRYTGILHPDRAMLVAEIEMMRRARLGPFKDGETR